MMREYDPKSTNEVFWLKDSSCIENFQSLCLVEQSMPVSISGKSIHFDRRVTLKH